MWLVRCVPIGSPAVVQFTASTLKLCLALTDMIDCGLYAMRLAVNYLMYFVLLTSVCLCDELITRPEESYRWWCVVECDLETL